MINNKRLTEENGSMISDRPGMAKPANIVAANNQQATVLSTVDNIKSIQPYRFKANYQVSCCLEKRGVTGILPLIPEKR